MLYRIPARLWITGLLLAALPGALSAHAPGPVSEGASGPEAAVVDEALAEARARMAKGQWQQAKAGLVEMLGAVGAVDHVVVRWPRIADALSACTFWSSYETPEPEDVVPEIVSWKEKRGALKLRYERGGSGARDSRDHGGDFNGIDLEGGGTLHLHPVRFTGPYSIELSGRKLDTRPVLYVDWLWNSLKGLGFGTSYAVIVGDLTGVWAFEGGEMELVDSCSTLLKFGRPYKFEVRVASNSVSVSYNGKRQLKIKRPKGEYGQFGLQALDAFEEIEIVGEVEPAWIAGLVQDEVFRAWATFSKGYDPLGEAPDALRDRVAGEARKQVDFGLSCPGKPSDEVDQLLAKAKGFVDEEEYEEGLAFAQGLDEEAVPAVVRDWILANFQLFAGDAEACYEALGRVVEADPEFYEGRLYRAYMGQSRESENDALLEHEELILDFPGYVEPYESLALFHLYSGRLEDAEEVLEVAVANEVPIQALQDVGVTLLRKRYGPGWPEADSYSSNNYVVYSNAGKTVCVRIATELDQTLRRYQAELGRISDKDAPKFPVYFFAGEAGYQSYCKDLLGAPAHNTLGVFHPALKQLLVWDSPNPGSTMRTVRHEGFHQFFDRLVGDSPVWLNEGMAEYYEQARFVGGRWKDDQVNVEHVALLEATRGDWTPLETFVRMDNRAFRAKSGLHYPQGWAFVHFMLNGGSRPKKMFNELLDGLKEGLASSDAVEAAFAGVDFRELEREFAEHVDSLK